MLRPLLAPLAMLASVACASCGNGGGTCTPASVPRDPMYLAGAIAGTAGVQWGSFLYRHGGDCDPAGAPHGQSVTIQGQATSGAGAFFLCIPDPSKIQDGVAYPLQPGGVFAMSAVAFAGTAPGADGGAGCGFTSSGGATATVTFAGSCGFNATTGADMTAGGHVSVQCGTGGPSTELDLSGTTFAQHKE